MTSGAHANVLGQDYAAGAQLVSWSLRGCRKIEFHAGWGLLYGCAGVEASAFVSPQRVPCYVDWRSKNRTLTCIHWRTCIVTKSDLKRRYGSRSSKFPPQDGCLFSWATWILLIVRRILPINFIINIRTCLHARQIRSDGHLPRNALLQGRNIVTVHPNECRWTSFL